MNEQIGYILMHTTYPTILLLAAAFIILNLIAGRFAARLGAPTLLATLAIGLSFGNGGVSYRVLLRGHAHDRHLHPHHLQMGRRQSTIPFHGHRPGAHRVLSFAEQIGRSHASGGLLGKSAADCRCFVCGRVDPVLFYFPGNF